MLMATLLSSSSVTSPRKVAIRVQAHSGDIVTCAKYFWRMSLPCNSVNHVPGTLRARSFTTDHIPEYRHDYVVERTARDFE